jgi:Leucine-rich repeat (LRR) protein
VQAEARTQSDACSFLRFAFEAKAAPRIVVITNAHQRIPSTTIGLELPSSSTELLQQLGESPSKILYLKLRSSAENLTPAFFRAISSFTNLEHLHIQAQSATEIPDSIAVLSTLPKLLSLSIDASRATNWSAAIYRAPRVQELWLRAFFARLPAGISEMPNLERVELWSSRSNSIRSLPPDLKRSKILCLNLGTVSQVEALLPCLPPSLLALSVAGSPISRTPKSWLKHERLETMALTHDGLTQMPSNFSGLPKLKLLNLNLNGIKMVPRIKTTNPQLKISLIANPLKQVAPQARSFLEQ